MSLSWLSLFPDHIQSMLRSLPSSLLDEIEEIRLREGRALEVNAGGHFYYLTAKGEVTSKPEHAYRPSRKDSNTLLDLITNHSLYTMEEELRRGFITIAGGHRVGLSGRTVLSGGQVAHLRDISGFNVRVAREVQGVADHLLPKLLDFKQKSINHTLIISPPQQGKTTMIRDLARQISYGTWRHPKAQWQGLKVAVIDERSEIAGSKRGVPSFDVGPRTDVMDGCPKAEGMMMMIRSMSPDVLIVDEIGRKEDIEALIEALHAGVRVIATAHGSSVEELQTRLKAVSSLGSDFFKAYVVLSRKGKAITYKLWDDKGRTMLNYDDVQRGKEYYG
ncbi:stage III sporulation protein AA [Paenibacillus turicensis]|uniref:stage III sporulation protein AA n=1 Tax=Paenibacillus turicensis TaxID=160487 RepID=UPI003D2C72CA